MKALFLADNIPAVEMFIPVIAKLPDGWDAVLVNYEARSVAGSRLVTEYARRSLIRCIEMKRHDSTAVEQLVVTAEPDIIVFSREETTLTESMFVELGIRDSIPTLLIPHGIMVKDMHSVWSSGKPFTRTGALRMLLRQACGKIRRHDTSLGYLFKTGAYRITHDFKDDQLSRWNRYTAIAAYGEAMRDVLLHNRVSPESIVITGNPKMDMLHPDDSGKDSRRILLLTNYFVEFGLWSKRQRKRFVLDVCAVAKATTDKPLRIKIHPVNERMADYESLAAEYDLDVELYQQAPITEVAEGCSLAITTTSSAGLEAMVLGKPLIIYNPYGNVTAYGEDSGAYIALSATQLAGAVSDILDNGIGDEQKRLAEQFIINQASARDGKSADRIVALMVEMTDKTGRRQVQ